MVFSPRHNGTRNAFALAARITSWARTARMLLGRPATVGRRLRQIAALEPDRVLREDIGDAEYERYLRALGREPMVNVMTVLENSPAARAGMRAGDRIVSYGGARVFDFREITPLTLQGMPGESVVVELMRDGQPMQIVVPRGPLGVSLSSAITSVRGAAQQQ